MFPNLGRTAEWKLIVCSDAAHADLCDGINSMRGYLVLLTGLSRRCCPFSWQTNKIKGVVRSTIAADTLSLQERLEDRIYLCKLLEELLGSSINEILISTCARMLLKLFILPKSPCITCVQYRGGVQYHGSVHYRGDIMMHVGGYHDKCRGIYLEYGGRCSVPWGYHEYRGGGGGLS